MCDPGGAREEDSVQGPGKEISGCGVEMVAEDKQIQKFKRPELAQVGKGSICDQY